MTKKMPRFTVRTLLLFATVMGPLIGWYGPAICDYVASKFGNEKVSKNVVPPLGPAVPRNIAGSVRIAIPSLGPAPLTWQNMPNTYENRRRWQPYPGVSESTERGMQADAWQRRTTD